jgi:hypothetical protein
MILSRKDSRRLSQITLFIFCMMYLQHVSPYIQGWNRAGKVPEQFLCKSHVSTASHINLKQSFNEMCRVSYRSLISGLLYDAVSNREWILSSDWMKLDCNLAWMWKRVVVA